MFGMQHFGQIADIAHFHFFSFKNNAKYEKTNFEKNGDKTFFHVTAALC